MLGPLGNALGDWFREEAEDSDRPVAMLQHWRIVYIENMIFSEHSSIKYCYNCMGKVDIT